MTDTGPDRDEPSVTLDKESPAQADSQQAESKQDGSRTLDRKTVLIAAVLAVAVVASAVGALVLYLVDYRADQRVDASVQSEVLSAATDGAASVLTYSPDTLDADFDDAKSRLTGDFLQYYTGFTEQVVGPAARENGVTTEATVMGSAITSLDDASAVVLVFVNQSTTSTNTPDPNLTSSSVRLGLNSEDGRWLISSFDPV